MAILGNPLLPKNYTAGAAIAPFRIVKFGAADGEVVQAAAATDLSIGVSGSLPATAAGERIDIIRAGLTPVALGGTVTRGDKLTADANGAAVTAAPAAGANANIIGIAEVSGVAGDVALMLIAPSIMQG